jgi:peptidyl-prolyl cis-trans isomerase SurA
LIQRRGEEADVRHILIKPKVTSADFKVAMSKLDSIRNLLVTGKMGFPEAVGKFSTDEAAKRTGGIIANPSTGSTDLDVTTLDPGMVIMLDSLKPGMYSKPHIFMTDSREQSARIIYLRSRTDPHKANLKDDYNKIQELALYQKKGQKTQAWVAAKVPTFYLWVAPEYRDCAVIRDWKSSGSKP